MISKPDGKGIIVRFTFSNRVIPWCAFLLSISCQPSQTAGLYEHPLWEEQAYPGGLTILTDDSVLAARFNWAASQALSYAHSGDDPVGKWYEAALPDREAFCMRDVSHQSLGAHYLGLQDHTKNMLYKFAENISESRDWCSYWEINRYDQPAPVDYANDQEFWYNLPANFDVLIACYDQYLLTGDNDYLQNPVFVNFYQHTMDDYIKAWDLDIASVMTRDRFMNLDAPLDSSYSFQVSRGLPSYGEGEPLRLYLGADLFCLQYQAYLAYEEILRLKGACQSADSIQKVSQKLKDWYNLYWWSSKDDKPYSSLLTDGTFKGNPSRYILQSQILQSSHRQEIALQGLLSIEDINIESQSYLPKLFYNFDEQHRAFEELMDLSHPMKERKEYPEVSYAIVEAILEGLMGLSTNAHKRSVRTISRLTQPMSWVQFDEIPLFEGSVSIIHQLDHETTLKSSLKDDIYWTAAFYGNYDSLWTPDGPMSANLRLTSTKKEISWIQIQVPPNMTATIKIFGGNEN